MRLARRFLCTALLALAVAPPAGAQSQSFSEGGAAIRGYDAVAYHTEGRPVRGNAAFTFDWSGATWRFASAANRDLFAADPSRYAPAYGGFCAYAVSEGYTAPTDPNAWRIVNGQLFLNYNRTIQRRWEQDIPGRILRGNANWPRLSAS